MLVPELVVSDITRSRAFYEGVLGFRMMWERPAEGFVYLAREGAEVMLDALSAETAARGFLIAPLEPPFGRGVNLMIQCADVDALHSAVTSAGARITLPLEERWYRTGGFETGCRQFITADPDGYLLRFYTDIGARYR